MLRASVKTWVTLEVQEAFRTFIVESNAAGVVYRIKERKMYGKGQPWQCEYDAVCWHAHHRRIGAHSRSLPRRIIDAAKEAYAAS